MLIPFILADSLRIVISLITRCSYNPFSYQVIFIPSLTRVFPDINTKILEVKFFSYMYISFFFKILIHSI